MEPTLSKKKIETFVKRDVLMLFGIPMFLFVAFILVITGMIMYNRYALPLNTILIVDGIAVSVLSAFVGYLALYHKH
jgi:cytochrome b subunit of formate dehydrogenase